MDEKLVSRSVVVNNCRNQLEKALELAEQLLIVADEGDAERQDIGCGILFGTMRDCGYKLQALVEREIAEHKRKGIWGE